MYSDLEKHIFYPIINIYKIPDCKKKYILKFYIHGIMAVIKEWTINDCEDKIDDIVNIIIECSKII